MESLEAAFHPVEILAKRGGTDGLLRENTGAIDPSKTLLPGLHFTKGPSNSPHDRLFPAPRSKIH